MTTVYSVPGISCGHCKQAIETEVSKVSGVEMVLVDIDSRTVRIEGEGSVEALRAAIESAGYDVTSVTSL